MMQTEGTNQMCTFPDDPGKSKRTPTLSDANDIILPPARSKCRLARLVLFRILQSCQDECQSLLLSAVILQYVHKISNLDLRADIRLFNV